MKLKVEWIISMDTQKNGPSTECIHSSLDPDLLKRIEVQVSNPAFYFLRRRMHCEGRVD
jgi:hypothetical protein